MLSVTVMKLNNCIALFQETPMLYAKIRQAKGQGNQIKI